MLADEEKVEKKSAAENHSREQDTRLKENESAEPTEQTKYLQSSALRLHSSQSLVQSPRIVAGDQSHETVQE